jgi:thiol-disulfide isomerase/thioredoxin
MSKLTAVSVLVVALLGAPRAEALPPGFVEIPFDEAQALAATEGKKILVKVYTTWCEPCKRLDAKVLSGPEVQAELSRLVAVAIDAEKPDGVDFIGRYGVTRYPTTLFLAPDGKEETRLVGFREKPGFLKVFHAWLGGTLAPATPAVAADPHAALRSRWQTAFAMAVERDPRASEALASLLDSDRDNAQGIGALALFALGTYVHAEAPGEAARTFEELTRRFPDSDQARQAAWPWARALAAVGKARRGAAVLEGSAKARGGDPGGWVRLAHFAVLHDAADRPAVAKKVRAAARLFPGDAALWEMLARLEASMGRSADAREALERAIALRPDLPYYQELRMKIGVAE